MRPKEELQAKLGGIFTTQQAGEPRAYFELFNDDGTLRSRGIYRVYAFRGTAPPVEFEKAMTAVFVALREQAGEEGHLYWRRPLEWSDDQINARICVLNKERQDVTQLPDWTEDTMGRLTKDIVTGKTGEYPP